jgi:hypothetical protein
MYSSIVLSERAGRSPQVLDEPFVDPQGLMYSFLNTETPKPFTSAEVKHYPIKFPGALPLNEWLSGENTGTVAGNYLSALCYWARVEPCVKVNVRLERVLSCRREVYEMSERVKEPGCFCKPHGGKPSNKSTNDQFGGAIAGLRDLAELPGYPPADEGCCLVHRKK